MHRLELPRKTNYLIFPNHIAKLMGFLHHQMEAMLHLYHLVKKLPWEMFVGTSPGRIAVPIKVSVSHKKKKSQVGDRKLC